MELSTNSSGLCCTSMQVLGGGRGLVLLVQQSKETSDCVVCFDSHRSEEPSEMRGTSRVALGFMKYYLRLQQAGSTVFGFDLWASAPLLPTPLGWNIPPGRGSGIFLWDVGVLLCVCYADWSSEHWFRVVKPSTAPPSSYCLDTPPPTPPSPLPTHNLSSWAQHMHWPSCICLLMLNNSPHVGMLAHSGLWPRFSGTAPWWTCRRTRRSASL